MINKITCLLVMTLIGCGSVSTVSAEGEKVASSSANGSNSANKSTTITIKLNETVQVSSEHLTIKLTQLQDSRCPLGAQCIVAGQVIAILSVQKKAEAANTISLTTPPNAQNSDTATMGEYSIKLVSVEPFPNLKKPTPTESAQVTLKIDKH